MCFIVYWTEFNLADRKATLKVLKPVHKLVNFLILKIVKLEQRKCNIERF